MAPKPLGEIPKSPNNSGQLPNGRGAEKLMGAPKTEPLSASADAVQLARACSYLQKFGAKLVPAIEKLLAQYGDFAALARESASKEKQGEKYREIHASVDSLRSMLANERHNLIKLAGLKRGDAEVDALIGLEHNLLNIGMSPFMYAALIRREEAPEPAIFKAFESTLAPFTAFCENLRELDRRPEVVEESVKTAARIYANGGAP